MEFLSRIVLVAVLWINIGPTLTTTAANAQDMPDIRLKTTESTLTVSPNVCELGEAQALCQLTVALVWEVPRADKFCLYYQQKQQVLHCWDNAFSGVHQLQFKADSNATFLLTRGETNVVVAEAKLKVIGAIEQQLRARRRSGFWRIF